MTVQTHILGVCEGKGKHIVQKDTGLDTVDCQDCHGTGKLPIDP